MAGRLIEAAYILARFGWFYAQAPKKMQGPGFHRYETPTIKARAKWAWMRTGNQI
jgi:hypothetical protein